MGIEEKILAFVVQKNTDLNLGLDPIEVRELAEAYYRAAADHDLTYTEDAVLDDALFDEVYKTYTSTVPSLEDLKDPAFKRKLDEIEDEMLEKVGEDYTDDDLKRDTQRDKVRNSHYGYGTEDRDDDMGLDEIADDDETMHLSM